MGFPAAGCISGKVGIGGGGIPDTLERDHVLVPRPCDHHGIHFSGPEGAQGVFGRSQPVPQLFQSSRGAARRLASLDHER
jgi:hypothetical protein